MILEQLNTILSISDKNSNEYIIASYFISHGNLIINVKMNEIIKNIGVSKSTIVRFCQSLGYKNYTEFQYVLFFEMSSLKKYDNSSKTEKYNTFYFLDKKPKRIIAIGDGISLSSLLVYKQIFSNIGIQLEINLKYNTPLDMLKAYNPSIEDIVFYVSLLKTNLEISADINEKYLDIICYLENKNVQFIYIGPIIQNENEKNYIEIKKRIN